MSRMKIYVFHNFNIIRTLLQVDIQMRRAINCSSNLIKLIKVKSYKVTRAHKTSRGGQGKASAAGSSAEGNPFNSIVGCELYWRPNEVKLYLISDFDYRFQILQSRVFYSGFRLISCTNLSRNTFTFTIQDLI